MRRVTFITLLTLFIFILAAGADTTTPPSSQSNSTTETPATSIQTNSIPGIAGTGTFREYSLPQTNSGVMRPAIDHEGRIWFGEMGHNYLAVFDPRTQTFQQITPPRGRSGIMGVVVAPDDTIWFAEQYANYIGNYFSTTRQFHVYPLPTVTTPDPSNPGQTLTLPSAPNDLAMDTHGNIWFTEMNADSLARLDPLTGNVR